MQTNIMSGSLVGDIPVFQVHVGSIIAQNGHVEFGCPKLRAMPRNRVTENVRFIYHDIRLLESRLSR